MLQFVVQPLSIICAYCATEKGHEGIQSTVVFNRSMSLQKPECDPEKTAAEILAELADRPVEEFEYEGEIPDAEEQEWQLAEDDE